jgi:hypothetical protein
VDGDIVSTSLTKALATPVIDVDLILENVRDELEIYWQAPDVVTLNATAYNSYLKQNFIDWPYTSGGLTTGELIANQYQDVTNVNVVRSYYDLNADIGIYCANVELAKTAATYFKSRVYVSAVFQPPSHNIVVDPTIPELADPVHYWDYIAATGAWNFFESNGGNVLSPNSSQNAVPAYVPSLQDSTLGDLLQAQFFEFIVDGKVTNGMAPINSNGFPNNYNVAVQGDANWSGKVNNTLNFRSNYCNLLKTVGLEPNGNNGLINDGRFWWIN